jgi:hypothetical protein
MPRRLSNPEWVAFQNQVNLSALALPPWGGVVQWEGRYILVYICPADGGLCRKGEAMLTDVTDRADLIRNIPGTYDTAQETWVYHVPAELMARLVAVAQNTLQATGTIIETVAETVGEAAGALTQPLLENLALPLIVLGIAFVILNTPRRG